MRKLSLALLLLVLVPRPARALGLVVGADTTDVRVAVASEADRTTHWYSITTTAAEPVLWVIPTGHGAAIDAASNAWFEALDTITAPRIAPSCGTAKMEVARTIELGVDPPLPDVAVATTPAELDAALGPFSITDDERKKLEALLPAHDLALVVAKAPTPATIRVVDRETAVTLPFSLVRSARPVDVTAFVLADRRASLGAIAPAPASLHWFGNKSDWTLRRDAVLASAGANAFITESSLSSSVVGEVHVAPATVPSLALEYFSRASVYGDAVGSPSACANAASSMGSTLQPPYCARADLAGLSILPCAYSSALACGSHADDLALAAGGFVPRKIWITRMFGRIQPGQPQSDLPMELFAGEEVGLLRVALATCAALDPPPSGGPGGGGSDTSSSWGGSGGCGGSAEESSSSPSDGCEASATDDTSTDDSGACGSSSTDGSANDGCSGDTGGGGGDDCDSGGGGDGCDSGGGGSGDCDANNPPRKKNAGRSPLSRGFLALAFVALPLRRLSRKRG